MHHDECALTRMQNKPVVPPHPLKLHELCLKPPVTSLYVCGNSLYLPVDCLTAGIFCVCFISSGLYFASHCL